MKLTNNDSGFTMIEILLTMVALAAIGVAGYFAYSNLQKNAGTGQPAAVTDTSSDKDLIWDAKRKPISRLKKASPHT